MSGVRARCSTWPALFVTIAVLAQIAYPLTPDSARPQLTGVIVVAAAAAALVHALTTAGGRGLGTLLGAAIVAGGAEVVGVQTGVPFGDYMYLDHLGPVVLGVPWLVVAAWVSMAWPAAVVARRITARPWLRILVGAWALFAWDVFLDPQMVTDGNWRWLDVTAHVPGIPDVPLSNFGGWIAMSLIVSALLQTAPIDGHGRTARPLVAYYVWTALSSALAAAAFWGRPAVAAWGLLAMGPVAVAAVLRRGQLDSSRAGGAAVEVERRRRPPARV